MAGLRGKVKSVSALIFKPRERSFPVGKTEIARQRARLIGIVAIAPEFSTELQAVLAAQIAERILINVTLGRVHVLAPNAKKWGDRIMAAEAHGRETVVRNSRNSKLRR